jgi:hypothetical protein
MGTKSSLQSAISAITGIPTNVLLKGDTECASIPQRMSWASKRKTTRVEDLAYCLMGIFGINMPMLYGEGERAFIRLQEEIMKVSDDYSLFAWDSINYRGGLLATSSAAFSNSGDVIPLNPSHTLSGAITVNNEGIHLKLRFSDKLDYPGIGLAILPYAKKGGEVAIRVTATSGAKEYFERIQGYGLRLLNPKASGQLKYREIWIRRRRLMPKNRPPLERAAEIGNEAVVKLLLERGINQSLKIMGLVGRHYH